MRFLVKRKILRKKIVFLAKISKTKFIFVFATLNTNGEFLLGGEINL
jgi:hypothetical protein